MSHRIAIAIGTVVLLGLTACGSTRPTSPPQALNCDLDKYSVKDIFTDRHIYLRSQLRTESLQSNPPSFNVLSLSAGGEFGAYGAGFLVGWGSVGPAALPSPRSDIQVVTGVSTGAIMATHAFLGQDKAIEDLYTHSSGPAIYKERSLVSYIWANSLFDTSGKDRLIDNNLTSQLIDEVAKEAAKGRYLYAGMVNLDSGEFVRINLTKLASEMPPGEKRDGCYRAVIGASSAIPIAFSPKFIDGHMWVDGGARKHLFITETPTGALGETTRRLFSFVHGDLDVGTSEVKNGVLQIAGRTAELETDEGMKGSIRLQDFLASTCPRGVNCGPQKKLFETYYASAAKAAADCSDKLATCQTGSGLNSEDMFCQPYMQCLAKKGEADGASYARGKWLTVDDLCLGSDHTCKPSKVLTTMPQRRFIQ